MLLDEARRAIELEALHKPQSVVDKGQAEAVSALLSGLTGSDSAAIQVGSILISKTTDSKGHVSIQVRTLTQQQLIALEKTPDLLSNPERLFSSESVAMADHKSSPLPISTGGQITFRDEGK